MKKYMISSILALSLGFLSLQTRASEPIRAIDEHTLAQMTDAEKEATLLQVKERLLELKSLDKSKLSKAEKLAIKLEKKNAKAIAKGLNSRVSISLGAIIIAVLLIIIIF